MQDANSFPPDSAENLNPFNKRDIRCLCGCPQAEHGPHARGAGFGPCEVRDAHGKPHCYGFVGPEDEIDA